MSEAALGLSCTSTGAVKGRAEDILTGAVRATAILLSGMWSVWPWPALLKLLSVFSHVAGL